MGNFSGILSVARGALSTAQRATQIASHNIANANTPGYSRQREVLSSNAPEATPQGIFGTGVTLTDVQRTRDALLDQEYRSNNGDSSGAAMRSQYLQRMETVFNEPSDTGLSSALDSFYGAWSDLASDPTNASARIGVQQAGSALARQFNNAATQLATMKADTVTRAEADITTINRISNQIADYNTQIVSAESGGKTASDLRDSRDQLLDTLSGLANVRVIDHTDGSLQVLFGNISLVDGPLAKQVSMSTGGTMGFQIVGSADTIRNIGGELGALQDVYSTDIANATSKLDALAAAVITDVNAVHRTGWSPSAGNAGNSNPSLGATGSQVDFFDSTPANATAAHIRLSDAVSANYNAIAVSDTLNEQGNNRVGLALAALRDSAPSAANVNFGADFRALVGDVAGSLNEAKNTASVASTMADQSNQRRTSVFGVSMDEELIQIMKQQQAYAAASKIIKTVDEMMQTLLSLKQ